MDNVTVEMNLPRDILLAANMSEISAHDDIKKILSLYLFKERILSLGKACELSNMNKMDFIEFVGSKNISLNYDVEDYQEDLYSLRGIDL